MPAQTLTNSVRSGLLNLILYSGVNRLSKASCLNLRGTLLPVLIHPPVWKETMCPQRWHATTRKNPGECQGEGRAQYCKGMGKGGGRVGVRGRHSETIGGGRGDDEKEGKATRSEHRVPKPAL